MSRYAIYAVVLSPLLTASAESASFIVSIDAPGITLRDRAQEDNQASDENEAAQRFVARLETLIAKIIVPGIRQGIIAKSTVRPPALRIEVTDDPSPFHLAAGADSDGTLRVRLSLGYVAMHDAALDAAMLSGALHRPEQLRSYLSYQLALARENEQRQASGNRRHRAMSFAQYAQLDDEATHAVYAQELFRRERDQIEVSSLGWVVAYLLERTDPRLAGESPSAHALDGRPAAVLASASGWFPVPPIATALGLAEVAPSTSGQSEVKSNLCRAASLVEQGVQVLRISQPWSSQLERDPDLQHKVAAIQAEVARIRRIGDCTSAVGTAAWLWPRGVTESSAAGSP